MQAIQTKFFGWSTARDAYRIKATAPAGAVWHEFGQTTLTNESEHEAAAAKLMARFGWDKTHCLVSGSLADGSVVWIQTPKPEPERIDWTRVRDGRIVCHFLELNTRAELDKKGAEWIPIDRKYELALIRARRIGGRKFHNKQFGGGIVFTGDIDETEKLIKGLVS